MIADKGRRGRVEVVDGQTGAGGLGCLVLAAAEAAGRGPVAASRWSRPRAETREGLEMWFCLDTLEYLRKGGRIGAAQALLGSALKIKPILTFGTEIAPVGRVRTKKRAMERMVAYLRELHERGADGWIVQHAQCPRTPPPWSPRAKRSSAPSRSSAPRSAPSSAPTSAPAMLVGGIGCAPADG